MGLLLRQENCHLNAGDFSLCMAILFLFSNHTYSVQNYNVKLKKRITTHALPKLTSDTLLCITHKFTRILFFLHSL